MIVFRIVVFVFSSSLFLSAAAYTCLPLPYVGLPNGRIRATDYQDFQFECNRGYFLGGPSMTRCYKGNWTSVATPVCYEAEGRCDRPPDVANADKFETTENKVGSVMQYLCHIGFVMLGNGRRTCLESGSWSGITPACINESEPLQSVADRLGKEFIMKLGSYSNESDFQQARYLDKTSLQNGLELIVLIDRSSSVDPVDLNIAKAFINYLFRKFKIRNGDNINGTRAAVIAFGTVVDILFNLDDSLIDSSSAAKDALNNLLLADGGGTAMVPALTAVFLNVEPLLRSKAKRALFLISDGEPNVGSEGITPEDMAKQLKEHAKFEIFSVGIGPDANRQLLSTVVTEPVFNHLFLLKRYSDFNSILALIENRPADEPTLSLEKCGHLEEETEEWPWMGAVYISMASENTTQLRLCAGILICSEWMLTAASCFFNIQDRDVRIHIDEIFVVLREQRLIKNDPLEQNFYASNVVIHPDYDPFTEFANNVALIQLNSPAPLETFRPVCLPPTDRTVPLHLELSLNSSVAGWGISPPNEVSDEIAAGNLRFQLGMSSVTLAEERECLKTIPKTEPKDSIFCAETRSDKICLGILGSPVVTQDFSSGIHHVLGILISRKGCKGGYSHYTELRKFLPWINDVTKNCHFIHYN